MNSYKLLATVSTYAYMQTWLEIFLLQSSLPQNMSTADCYHSDKTGDWTLLRTTEQLSQPTAKHQQDQPTNHSLLTYLLLKLPSRTILYNYTELQK